MWGNYEVDEEGALSKDQIKSFLKDYNGPGFKFTLDKVDKIFEIIDTDHNGSVDKEEMIDFIK